MPSGPFLTYGLDNRTGVSKGKGVLLLLDSCLVLVQLTLKTTCTAIGSKQFLTVADNFLGELCVLINEALLLLQLFKLLFNGGIGLCLQLIVCLFEACVEFLGKCYMFLQLFKFYVLVLAYCNKICNAL